MAAMFYQGLTIPLLAVVFVVNVAQLAYSLVINRTGLAKRLKRGGYSRCPHYQHADIIWGSDYQAGTVAATASGTRRQWHRDQFAKYGKTFETGVRGMRRFHTCDSVNAQALLTSPSAGVGPSRSGLLSWLGPGVFTVDGEMWKHSRDMLKPIFKKAAISDMTRLEQHLNRLMRQVETEEFEVDLQALFIRMFLDFSMDLLIGEDINTVSHDYSKVDVESFFTACDNSQLQVLRAFQPWLVRWWKGWTKTWNEPLNETQAFAARYVDSALQDSKTPDSGPIPRSPAFLDYIIQETGGKDKAYLRDQILNVFMPGRDAAAIMISHVMYYLARSPSAYEKVRAEVLSGGFETKPISYDALKNLPYTNAVITESLRLAGPPNGQTGRDVLSDIVLPRGGGVDGDQPILVPKGSVMHVQIQTMHRDPEAWGPDPDIFRPERWIESSKAPQRLAFEYMPFGGGRRICPAMALGMGELAYIVASFALRFREIQNRDPPEQEMLEEGAIVMKIKGGVRVKLVE